MPSPRLTVQVLSPTDIIYAGTAISVTSFNDTGKFDVLPYHANFVSIIKKSVVVQPDKKTKKELKIDSGVLHCKEDKVHVFVGFNEEQITAAKAEWEKGKKKT